MSGRGCPPGFCFVLELRATVPRLVSSELLGREGKGRGGPGEAGVSE
jgi:hypothetical protein